MAIADRTFFLILSLGQDFPEEEFIFFFSVMMTSPLPEMEEIGPAAFFPSLLLAAVVPCISFSNARNLLSHYQSMTHHNVPPGMDVLLSTTCSL